MNNLHDDSDDEDDLRSTRSRHRGHDREITLGTTMILLIFFALAVYGAVLFGFGYSLGSKHNGSQGAVMIAGGSSTGSGGFKPSPGSPIAGGGANKTPPADSKPVSLTTPPVTQTKTVPLTSSPNEDATADSEPKPRPTASVPTAAPAPISSAGDSAASGPAIVVQVAALSQQADAESIVTSLQHRGYTVNIRTEADKLYHVQVGPFYSRKDADAMKARLLADGFNAYIK